MTITHWLTEFTKVGVIDDGSGGYFASTLERKSDAGFTEDARYWITKEEYDEAVSNNSAAGLFAIMTPYRRIQGRWNEEGGD